jgi:hypothetical protein
LVQSAIMADAAEADAANLLNVAAQLVVAESELLALLLRERKRKRALLAPAEVLISTTDLCTLIQPGGQC